MMGIFQYYRKVNTSYRNPFFPGIRKVRGPDHEELVAQAEQQAEYISDVKIRSSLLY
jgi:hypothetical protein